MWTGAATEEGVAVVDMGVAFRGGLKAPIILVKVMRPEAEASGYLFVPTR